MFLMIHKRIALQLTNGFCSLCGRPTREDLKVEELTAPFRTLTVFAAAGSRAQISLIPGAEGEFPDIPNTSTRELFSD